MTGWLDGTLTGRGIDVLEKRLDMRVFNLAAPQWSLALNGTTDDSAPFNAVLDAATAAGGGLLLVPPAKTILANSLVVDSSNITIAGYGPSSIIKQIAGVADNTYLLSAFGSGTTLSGNITGLRIHNLQLLGRADVDTATQYVHLVEFSGVSDGTIDKVVFKAWRGDAVILASNLTGGTSVERHNQTIRVEKCWFDGVNPINRNAITVSDGTDVTIEKNYFTNCTATNRPGAIDIEPNAFTYSRTEDIKIIRNHFDGVSGNAGVVGMFLPTAQASLTTPARNIVIKGNTIRNCTNSAGPIFLNQVQTPTDSTEPNDITVEGNHVYNNVGVPLEAWGIRGLKIKGNYWANHTLALAFGYGTKCMDVDIEARNFFYKIGTTEGNVIDVYTVDRLMIRQNTFATNGDGATTGRLVSFGAGSGGASTSTAVDFINNRVVGYASAASSKHASHTLTASTNTWQGNDTSLVPSTAHWAKQANLTYSRATETGQDAAMRIALAAAKLLTDNTTA